MEKVIIGVDPHKLSATIEVVDRNEKLLGSGRFTTDHAGYKSMRTYAKTWPDRIWAIEGATGTGRPLAQRLLEAGGDQRLWRPDLSVASVWRRGRSGGPPHVEEPVPPHIVAWLATGRRRDARVRL